MTYITLVRFSFQNDSYITEVYDAVAEFLRSNFGLNIYASALKILDRAIVSTAVN